MGREGRAARVGPATKRRRLGLGTSSSSLGANPKADADGSRGSAPPVQIDMTATFKDPEVRRRLREEFCAAAPFPHGVMRPFLGPEALQALRADLEKVQAVEKETDLFRFFQTSDLAALIAVATNEEVRNPRQGKKGRKAAASAAALAKRAPALLSLVKFFASGEFRELCSEITQCGELAPRVDLASQIYPRGGHLLCHDDVIGTRKVSFIYYMTDPSEEWTAAEGGALELYPAQEGAARGTPATSPSAELLPLADSLAFFLVEPGVSFHSVREVRGGRARVSMQGWLHAPSLEQTLSFQNRGLATLQQLLETRQSSDGAERESVPASGNEAATETARLSAEDIETLRPWLSPVYLVPEQLEAVAERFADNSYALLNEFLRPDVAQKVASALADVDAADGFVPDAKEPDVPPYQAGAVGGWEPVGPPHLRRYLRFTGSQSSATPQEAASSSSAAPASGSAAERCHRLGSALSDIAEQLFRGAAFKRWLQVCTRLEPRGHVRPEVRRFRPGMDYTVAVRTGTMSPEDAALDATLVFVAGDASVPDAAERWTGEEVGGFESYLAADEDDETVEAQEVYRDTDVEGPLVNLPATPNSLCLVMRDPGTLRFVKYLSRDAPSSRVDVAASFIVDAPAGDSASEAEQPEKSSTSGAGAPLA